MAHLRWCFLTILLAFSQASFAGNEALLGIWTTAEAKSQVEIFECGDALCGKIISLKEPNFPADDDRGMAGQPKVDRENPDPALRNKPTVGLQVLQGFKQAEDNLWKGGTVYDPENGKTYKCKLTLVNPKELKVRGYIGFSWIGRTSVWTR